MSRSLGIFPVLLLTVVWSGCAGGGSSSSSSTSTPTLTGRPRPWVAWCCILALLLMGAAKATAQGVGLISVDSTGTSTGNSQSFLATFQPGCGIESGFPRYQQCVSADGRFVVFLSEATDLVAGLTDSNGGLADVFVRDRLNGTTIPVSVTPAGTATGNSFCSAAAISADGTHVAFICDSTDQVTTPTVTVVGQLYVRNLISGTTTLASVNAAGADGGNGASSNPVLSADGTRAAFVSDASDLVATDSNSSTDVFLYDETAGTTTLISINGAGTDTGNSASVVPSISADGTMVAFSSGASDLGTVDTGFSSDIFVRNVTAGTTTLVSVNSAGTNGGNNGSQHPVISADGTHVAFSSLATNLVAGFTDGNGPAAADVFIRDLGAGTTTLVSINSASTATGNDESDPPLISENGNLVAFVSRASDLTSIADGNGVRDVFLRDVGLATTTLVSINSAGTASGNFISGPVAGAGTFFALSADGNRVAFASDANDLVATDTNATSDIFLRDLTLGTTTLISTDSAGTDSSNGTSRAPQLSADGGTVVFQSAATDLVTQADGNTSEDVFGFGAALAQPDISIDDLIVTEGNAGTTVATFTVSLSAPSASTVTVDFITNGVTATGGTDFVGGSGIVTFVPTDVSEPVTVTINGDLLDELNETFTVDLSNPSNATILDAQGVGTITDDDPPPTISIGDVTVTEGDTGTTNASFTVSLSAVSGLPVSVDFTTVDGSATQPGDYTLTTGTLVIPANTPSAPIVVPVVGDTTVEGTETFTVNLSLPVNATIADGTATGTITDNDGQDFTLTSVECCIECVAGFKATYHLTIAPVSTPVSSPVALSCSGLPSLSTCTFTPSSVTPGSSPANAVMLIETTGSAGSPGAALRTPAPIYAVWLGGAGLMAIALAGRSGRRRRLRAGVGAVLALLALSLGGPSCASSHPSTPPGTYPITIAATGANFTHTLEVTLIVRD